MAIQTNTTIKSTPHFKLLSQDQIHELVRAAFDVMGKVGFKVLHPDARDMLKKAGAIVKDDRVKVPEFIVTGCLSTAPKGWTLFNRNGERALEVTGRNSYFGTSTASPNTKDALTGEYHPTTVEDLARSAKIADALENIDWVMPMGSCQDVPANAADLHEFYATATNTVKPIVFLNYTPRGTELVYEMAAEIAGGMDVLRDKPFLVLYPESISPMVFPEEVIARMFVAADLFMPQMMGPTIQPGATGPITLAGGVAQALAESLMGLVICQLRRPGTPVGLGCNFGILDMRRGLMGVGAPEMSLGLALQAEVAQHFGLPTWGLAGSTDAKVLDAQAGAEAAFSLLAQGQAGLNLIHDVGYMDMGMACAVEQLVLGDEIIGMVRHFLRGVEISADTLAMEVIAKVGPGGNYLQEMHTCKNFRNELWQPSLFTRESYGNWVTGGSKDTAARVREKIVHILDTHKAPVPDDKTLEALQKIVARGEKELG